MSRFAAQIQQYQANNRGNVPATNKWNDFITSYLKTGGDDFTDPDGTAYTVTAKAYDTSQASVSALSTFDHVIHVYTNAKCNGEEVVKGTGTRNVAFQYKLEGAGTYCGNV